MTMIQLRKAQRRAQREKKKLQRDRAKQRHRDMMVRRKAKALIKRTPKLNLIAWGATIRSVGVCAVCGRGSPEVTLNAHHLLPKERYPEHKLRLKNGICLCYLHHKGGKFSAHRNSVWFSEWLKQNRPEQWRWCVANMGEHSTAAIAAVTKGKKCKTTK